MTAEDERRLMQAVVSEDAFNLLLWLATAVALAVLLAWVVLGRGGAPARAVTVRTLWPLALIWCLALLIKTSQMAETKREALRASAVAKMQANATPSGVQPPNA